MDNPNDLLAPNAPSGDTVKYKSVWGVGEGIQGTLAASPRVLPDTDFQTKEQKVSRNGNKLWKFGLTLEVDGEIKKLYPEGACYWAVLNAFKNSGLRRFEDAEGGVLAIRRSADSESQTAGFAPKKNYEAKFVLAPDSQLT